MCTAEQVVYIADKIEPGKPSAVTLRIEEIRPARRDKGHAAVNGGDPLKRFLLEHANHTIVRLVRSGMAMHPRVVEMRNWIIRGEG
jgi:HD superfamily phosphohydrolase YqeK